MRGFFALFRFFAALMATAVLLNAQPARAQAQADFGPTLSKIQRNSAIYVGHSEASFPFSYIQTGEDGEVPMGFSWDICMKIVDSVRARLDRADIKVIPVPLIASARIMMVKTGLVDMECGVTTNTLARQKQVSFSNTFFVSEVKIMVNKDSGIRSLADLSGKSVAVTSGTTADRLIKATMLRRNLTANFVAGRDNASSMDLLASGRAQAYVADDGVLYGQRSRQKNPSDYVVLEEGLSIEPYGMILPKGDPQFKAVVDETIVKLMQDGGFEEIYNKWFLQPAPPNNVALDVPISDILRSVMKFPNDQPAPPQ